MIDVKISFKSFEDAGRAMLAIAGVAPDAEAAFTAPAASEPSAAEPAPSEEKPKRTRRTKAEMEEARADQTEQSTVDENASEDDGKPMTAAEAEAMTKTPEQPEPESGVELTKEEAEAKFKNEVRPALQRVIAKHGQDVARDTLTKFKDLGLQKLSDIPVSEYDAFIAACAEKVA